MIVVDLTLVERNIKKLPHYIVEKLFIWAQSIETDGMQVVRMIRGYHDEPLKGARTGQRSVRLSKSYRVIYTEHKNGNIEIILVIEVNKHDY